MFIKGLLWGRKQIYEMCDIYEYVGSEQNFKNLVDKILDQLKKKTHDF